MKYNKAIVIKFSVSFFLIFGVQKCLRAAHPSFVFSSTHVIRSHKNQHNRSVTTIPIVPLSQDPSSIFVPMAKPFRPKKSSRTTLSLVTPTPCPSPANRLLLTLMR